MKSVKKEAKVKDLKNFVYWSHVDRLTLMPSLVLAKPRTVPFIYYSNGSPCIEANMYMHKLMDYSRSEKTLRTYSRQIIKLIQFVENQPYLKKFSDLTDASYRYFIQLLQTERNKVGNLKRGNNRVRAIGLTCLDFLIFIQEFHDLSNFIGVGKENSIQIKKITYKRHIPDTYKTIEGARHSHSCIPSKDEERKRLPVDEDVALKVWKHIQSQTNRDKRLRDIALYQTMEQLGARVTELHLITVQDYERAKRSGANPTITLRNLKRRDETSTRNIPVTKALLRDIGSYMKVRRRILLRRGVKDHGMLFIALNTGQPFKAESWTVYMNNWKRDLGIKGELFPHLYRHAFITNKLREIILQHKEINSADDFKRHLINSHNFKLKLKEWTGHTLLSSLDRYIHLIFSDLEGYRKAYNAVSLKESITIVERQLDSMKKQLSSRAITNTECMAELTSIIDAFKSDIADCVDDRELETVNTVV